MGQDQESSADNAESAEERSGPRPMRERCIPLRRVRGIQIEDDRTIIWEVGGGPINYYRMTLTNRCPGLLGRGAFVHSSSSSRLCDTGEWIRVAGGTRAICAIDRIEPWTPPEEETTEGDTEEDPEDE